MVFPSPCKPTLWWLIIAGAEVAAMVLGLAAVTPLFWTQMKDERTLHALQYLCGCIHQIERGLVIGLVKVVERTEPVRGRGGRHQL